MARYLGYMLGLDVEWNAAAGTGTFIDPVSGTTLILRDGASVATVIRPDGAFEVPVTAGGGRFNVDSRIIRDRFFVPLGFFPEIFPDLVNVQFISNTEGVIVTRLR
jgi:hypothetical protein